MGHPELMQKAASNSLLESARNDWKNAEINGFILYPRDPDIGLSFGRYIPQGLKPAKFHSAIYGTAEAVP